MTKRAPLGMLRSLRSSLKPTVRSVARHDQELGPLLALQARRRPGVGLMTSLDWTLRAGLSARVRAATARARGSLAPHRACQWLPEVECTVALRLTWAAADFRTWQHRVAGWR
eukprot:14395023-Alexandrium_andersonii.AAC.1